MHVRKRYHSTTRVNAIQSRFQHKVVSRRGMSILQFRFDRFNAYFQQVPLRTSLTSYVCIVTYFSLMFQTLKGCFRYVHNHEEAMQFLSDSLCIEHSHFEKAERSLREWITTPRANRGAFDKAVAWRPCYDISRDLICTIFGLELGSELDAHIAREKLSTRDAIRRANKKASSYSRLSVYMQRRLPSFPQGSRMEVFNSGTRGWQKWTKANTIVIYETTSMERPRIIDALKIQSLELRQTQTNDGRSPVPAEVVACENIVLSVLDNILRAWRRQITLLSVQHEFLEDQVYERPSDDSHAGGLWGMSQHSLELAKLVNRHSTLCQDVQEYFNVFSERNEGHLWLEDILKGFRQISVSIREDFIGPTDYMIDLVCALPPKNPVLR